MLTESTKSTESEYEADGYWCLSTFRAVITFGTPWYPFPMAIPKAGDAAVRTSDGIRFCVADVIEAGGEDLYKLTPEDGGESIEIPGAFFVREHNEERAEFEVVE